MMLVPSGRLLVYSSRATITRVCAGQKPYESKIPWRTSGSFTFSHRNDSSARSDACRKMRQVGQPGFFKASNRLFTASANAICSFLAPGVTAWTIIRSCRPTDKVPGKSFYAHNYFCCPALIRLLAHKANNLAQAQRQQDHQQQFPPEWDPRADHQRQQAGDQPNQFHQAQAAQMRAPQPRFKGHAL